MLSAQQIRDKLRRGQASIGSWLQLACPDAAEILAHAGYDWVAVDMEHGAFSRSDLPDIFRALALGGAAPFVRVAEAEMINIRSALDAGALGIILPMIESAGQLAEAMSHIYYPAPEPGQTLRCGRRGVGFCRANQFGARFSPYLEQDSRETLVVAQIEHISAVGRLEEILKVPGLDAIMIGPYDLSASMGIPGDFANPEFDKVMAEICRTVQKYNIPMGAHVVEPDPAVLQKRIAQGYLFLAYGIDTVFLQRMAALPSLI